VIRAVIDTNVLVSGLLTPNGNEALIILAIHQGFLQPCCSEAMLAEYAAVLARPKFAFTPDEIAALLAMLRAKGTLIPPSGPPAPALPDADDGKFLHCAESSQAEYIVTGNKRHFPRELCGAIRVVNAGALLDRITLEIRP
jgi:putative PIN family toxin of toxin-antitoxin system